MNNRIVRWRYIVDWKLQGSLILHGLAYGCLVLVALTAGIFAPLLWGLGGPQDVVTEEQSIVMLYLHERFWWIAAFSLGIVVLGSVRFSHRVAGPMVRFKRNLRLLGEGRLPSPLRTRGADFMKEEVVCLNGAVAGVGARIDEVRKAQSEVRRRIERWVAQTPEPQPELDELVAACAELDRAVRRFRYVETADSSRTEASLAGAAAAPAVESVEGV